MKTNRGAGVLCHISSLSGKYGIGSFGKEAYRFAKSLAKNGVTYWQVLPLVQTGFGDSPYSSVSCSSGNPYFIDLESLAAEGLLTKEELKGAERKGEVDYGALYAERFPLLRKAFSRFFFDSEEFRAYVKSGVSEEYALFMTAKTVFGGSFADWEAGVRDCDPDALEKLRTDYHEEYLFWNFLQYEFHLQWTALKTYCNGLGVKLIGDIPLYVAYDSADVWSHPELFKLDKAYKPVKVAGVPPDYFSQTGQLWGNPVYDWKAHEKEDFKWWKSRLRRALEIYDVVRIDHFRGIDRYYEISASEETAVNGTWKDGPKEKIFDGLDKSSVIAEDLGIIDEGVRTLLAKTGFSGMKVLLFAFDGNPDNPFLPENIGENSVCYIGTHDNDTVKGYVESLTAEEFILFRSRVAAALESSGVIVSIGKGGENFPEAFIRLAMSTKSRLAIVPIQDVLGLDNSARMNYPGTQEGNWRFRMEKQPAARAMKKLKKIIKTYRG
ncbi:MAG: 4-alpha-glucanotransferase [Clostridia bacterium]|nr:4-alpha-glucanotransferase [Clostridia bacterium]